MFGIYVHIPFCVKKCDYCDFFSVPCGRGGVPEAAYLEAVLVQLERDLRAHGIEGRGVASVYFGGGTPSLMSPAFFRSLLRHLGERFAMAEGVEVSCEANPGTVDRGWLADIRDAGITRLSIGVQSFDDGLLRELGRIHTAEDAMRAVAEAQDAGFESVGLDLMFGMPGETQKVLEEDVRTAMMFQPQHISAYQLTIEEGTPLYDRAKGRNYDGIDEDKSLEQMRTVARMLSRGGWNRYEISNYAKPGFECRHNLNYWRYGEYLGLGAGATSFVRSYDRTLVLSYKSEREGKYQSTGVPEYESTAFGRRWTQVRDVAKYMGGAGDLAESEEIDVRTAMAEFCFLSLRTAAGFEEARFDQTFGESFEDIYGEVAGRLASDGLLTRSDGRIMLTGRGIELANGVSERFLP